jgi:hypothetical protein
VAIIWLFLTVIGMNLLSGFSYYVKRRVR